MAFYRTNTRENAIASKAGNADPLAEIAISRIRVDHADRSAANHYCSASEIYGSLNLERSKNSAIYCPVSAFALTKSQK
jgi:hypothetical protein